MDWIIFISFLVLLGYGAYRIKNEPFDVEWKDVTVGPYLFYLPHWWKFEVSESQIDITCSDNFFVKIELQNHPLDFPLYVRGLRVEWDEEKFLSDENTFFSESGTKERSAAFHYIEGTALVGGEKRLYLQLFYFEDEITQQGVLVEARSPVLSGLREGPYVDHMLKSLTFA